MTVAKASQEELDRALLALLQRAISESGEEDAPRPAAAKAAAASIKPAKRPASKK